jgi:hypothetical protein
MAVIVFPNLSLVTIAKDEAATDDTILVGVGLEFCAVVGV